MNRFRILGIFLALSIIFGVGCSDDELYRSNELGSILEEQGDFKLSTFTLPEGTWEIADTVRMIRIKLLSHTDNKSLDFDVEVKRNTTVPAYSIYIPKSEEIPNSDYDLTAYLTDGSRLGTKLVVSFQQEMLHEIISSTIQYTGLTGEGTEDDPYIISSENDFKALRSNLRKDSTAYASGLYFRQTADFNAPDRSDTDEGRYYANTDFAGIYDGGGYSITVSYIGSRDAGIDENIGLFQSLRDGAQIQNLTIKQNMQGIKQNGGALAGSAYGNIALNNIRVEGSITDSGDNLGGFIGYVEGNLTITNSRLYASISGENRIGGLVGYWASGKLDISEFSNLQDDYTTELFTIQASGSYAGGICGDFKGECELSGIKLQHTISEEDKKLKVIYSASSNAGGLFGRAEIDNASAWVNVQILAPVHTDGSYSGGLTGYATLNADLSLQRCAFNSYVQCANEYVGGFFGYIKSDNHLILEGMARGNRIAQVDNGYLAVESGQQYAGGMFGSLEGDIQAKSECLINVIVTAKDHFAGGVAGKTYNNTLDGTYFVLDPNMSVQSNDAAGGLIGYALSCTIKGNIKEDEQDKGAISFDNGIPSEDSFESNYSGTVRDANGSDQGTSMGGIIGYAEDCEIEGLCFSGFVAGQDRVGGIVGHLRNRNRGYIKNCVNKSNEVKNNKNTCTGGIAGKLDFACGSYTYMINYGNVTGMDRTVGIFGYVGLETSTTNKLTIQYAVNTSTVSGGQNVGGCIGYLYDHMNDVEHEISYCANYGKVSNSGNGNVGGILGQGDSKKMVILYSANHGEIEGGSNGGSQVGGIAGRMGQDPGGITIGNNVELAYCCNRGSISSSNKDSHVGGLLGYQEEGNDHDDNRWMTHDCYNSGAVTSDQDSDNGGVIGCVDHYSEVVLKKKIRKVSHGNGVVGTHKSSTIWHHHDLYYLDGTGSGWCADSFKDSEKKNSSTFNNFNFSSNGIWIIDSDDSMNNGFPYLRNCPFQSIYK